LLLLRREGRRCEINFIESDILDVPIERREMSERILRIERLRGAPDPRQERPDRSAEVVKVES